MTERKKGTLVLLQMLEEAGKEGAMVSQLKDRWMQTQPRLLKQTWTGMDGKTYESDGKWYFASMDCHAALARLEKRGIVRSEVVQYGYSITRTEEMHTIRTQIWELDQEIDKQLDFKDYETVREYNDAWNELRKDPEYRRKRRALRRQLKEATERAPREVSGAYRRRYFITEKGREELKQLLDARLILVDVTLKCP